MFAFAIIGVLLAAVTSVFRRGDESIGSHPRVEVRKNGLRALNARSIRATGRTQPMRSRLRTLFRH